MQEEIENLKNTLPANGAYPGIVKVNKELHKKEKLPMITLQQVKNFFSGRSVSAEAVEPIIISTKKFLKQEEEREERLKI